MVRRQDLEIRRAAFSPEHIVREFKKGGVVDGTTSLNRYDCESKPAWCPGCGNFGILQAVQKALGGPGA